MFKVIIGGDIGFKDEELFLRFVKRVLIRKKKIQVVVGDELGPGILALQYIHTHYHVGVKHIAREVGMTGDIAQYRQHVRMCIYAEALIVFWDGRDKITRSLIRSAEVRGLQIRICRYKEKRQ
ncbi:MAG: hypothetical protein F6K19_01390 [Cyanothece sp. SIO1E1]|nr:hypothetical protein [Cyanothece sp. SIO1E1]